MKVFQEFSDPEHITPRSSWRLTITANDGTTLEVVEQMGGGFVVSPSVAALGASLQLRPIANNSIHIRVKP